MTSLIVNANDVIGAEVRNLQDEDLGKIEALMIDKLDGHVAYVVLSFGGLFGMGDKLFALPWSTFSYDKENECYIINISKERLKNSPGFDKDDWPDMSSPNWSTTIHNYYGTTQQ